MDSGNHWDSDVLRRPATAVLTEALITIAAHSFDMGVKLSEYGEEQSFGPVTKHSRTVKTPSKHEPEENRMVVYSVGNYLVKVSKVSDIGWSVTRYKDGEPETIEPGTYYDEGEAHECAREMVEEVA